MTGSRRRFSSGRGPAREDLAMAQRSKEDRMDWIQAAVIDRANELGLSSYEIAKRTGGRVSEDHVRDYVMGAKSMGSHKLQHVMKALGLTIAIEK
jgi:hypothetical protein